MPTHRQMLSLLAGTVALGVFFASPVGAIAPSRLADTDEKNAGDWLTYHGTYRSYHFSPLTQINADNVGQLKIAWMHQPGRATRGLQSMPLVADGILYYSGSYSRLFALNGATGQVKWSFFPQLDDDLVAVQTHSPYNRGIALGNGKVFVGTVDGRLIAVDMETGKPAWDTKLLDSKKLTVGFTGAPLVVGNTVIIGSQGGEWPYRGPIFGVDAQTGAKKWEFFVVAGTDEAKATWGGESWRTGGGGGWMPGTYDARTNTVWWGTGNPAPLYDWAGPKWKTEGPRPGDNLYTSSVIGLDPDTGKLKFHHQELPHDCVGLRQCGRRVSDDRPRRARADGPSQQGWVHLRLRPQQCEGGQCLAARPEHQLRRKRSTRRPASSSDAATWSKARIRTSVRRSRAASAGTRAAYSPQTGLLL